ncbi:MAG TPA: hypothetical protein VMN36_05470 [Verrucomicrobiales bacterium]|nr:hypothetical protein [Verrucomicrobiales bacterium]
MERLWLATAFRGGSSLLDAAGEPAEEVECLRLASASRAAATQRQPEAHQPRFLLVELQSELVAADC